MFALWMFALLMFAASNDSRPQMVAAGNVSRPQMIAASNDRGLKCFAALNCSRPLMFALLMFAQMKGQAFALFALETANHFLVQGSSLHHKGTRI